MINFEKLNTLDCVECDGTVDQIDVVQWIERMVRVIDQFECSDFAKFRYAISLLQMNAYDWWVCVLNAMVKPPIFTWDYFLKEFYIKYVPHSHCDSMKREFLNIRQ